MISLQEEIESLQEEGRIYEIVDLILYKGACRKLKPGWSKKLLASLEMNNFRETSDTIKPGELIDYIELYKTYRIFLTMIFINITYNTE